MNEHIKQLAEQCTSYNNSDGWMFDQEKFAELIVLECADIATYHFRRTFGDGSKAIKEHFGVEE